MPPWSPCGLLRPTLAQEGKRHGKQSCCPSMAWFSKHEEAPRATTPAKQLHSLTVFSPSNEYWRVTSTTNLFPLYNSTPLYLSKASCKPLGCRTCKFSYALKKQTYSCDGTVPKHRFLILKLTTLQSMWRRRKKLQPKLQYVDKTSSMSLRNKITHWGIMSNVFPSPLKTKQKRMSINCRRNYIR